MPGLIPARTVVLFGRVAAAPWFACLLLATGGVPALAAGLDLARLPAPASRPVDFAHDIRPILTDRCYSCHGPDRQKSDLRLDDRSAALKGGQHGPDIVPGRSADSPLIHFVAGLVEDMRMPPPGNGREPLSPEQVSVLRAWIDQGASWPETDGSLVAAKRANHWAFQPTERPVVPATQRKGWARTEIDDFILARLEKERLSPSPEADRRTLLRRASFDLTGLPPTPQEMDQFLADSSADAYERQVERLLSSPQYGERWARHWLDTVHFGETHGYDKDKTRPNAWPYRDYVVRALNSDKPYRRFVEEQLAGDVLYPDDPDGVVALGFIAAGPWDFVGHVELPETKTDGLIARYNDRDDMVMTTMSTFQSLTVHCARCHDHKFDPIAQEDYYALQAVFAGVDRADRWFDSDPGTFRRRKELLQEKRALETRQRRIEETVTTSSPAVFKLIDNRLRDLEKQATAARDSGKESSANGYHSEIAPRPDVTKWVQVELPRSVELDDVRLIPARPTDFTDTPGFGFPKRLRIEISDDSTFQKAALVFDRSDADLPNPGDTPFVVNARGHRGRFIRVTATSLWERTADYVFALAELEAYSKGENAALNASVSALDSIDAGRWSKKALVDGFSSRARLHGNPMETKPALAVIEREMEQLRAERQRLVDAFVDAGVRKEAAEVEASLKTIRGALATLPPAGTVFAAASDFAAVGSFKPAGTPRPVHVLRRGEVTQPIEASVPGTVSCVPGLNSRFSLPNADDEGSRRAALARWITDPANLLTRRSAVNRVWHYHFGRGLVETPNDFGRMGALPSHPELLDWLAYWFVDKGESLKQLHRLIVTSAAYRQSSASRPEGARLDADNRLLWRMNRARLDAESLRDTMLYVAGRLDLTMGGPSVQQFFFKDDHSPVYDYVRFDVASPGACRRSLYRFAVRSAPDPFMDTMDCPDASLLAPKRSTTLTALQALALLNDPFVLRQAEQFAFRVGRQCDDLAAQVHSACELALNRQPTAGEGSALAAYAERHGMPNLCRLVFNMSEFLFVD